MLLLGHVSQSLVQAVHQACPSSRRVGAVAGDARTWGEKTALLPADGRKMLGGKMFGAKMLSGQLCPSQAVLKAGAAGFCGHRATQSPANVSLPPPHPPLPDGWGKAA